MLPESYIEEYLQALKNTDKVNLNKIKLKLSSKYKLKRIPTDIEIFLSSKKNIPELIVTKPTRTISGVAVVALMTMPIKCPHGKCIYCPGGLNSEFGDVPQSYTGHEPSTMRGIRNDYDAYLQVMNRLEQYIVIGQNPEKVEVIIMGGTFPSFPAEYQNLFVKDAFKAMNDFSNLFYKNNELNLFKFKEFFELPGDKNDPERILRIKKKLIDLKNESELSLEQLHEINETSMIKCVGLTIETKPDQGFLEHGNKMLEFGATRVELGVQSVYEDIIKKLNRGHTLDDTKKSISELRDLGFKLNFHMMPGLPNVTEEMDENAFKILFEDDAYKPAMLKIYPTLVFRGTALYEMYKLNKFIPRDEKKTATLIAKSMKYVPEYCRIMRIQRDIPSNLAVAGALKNNLRQDVDNEIKKLGIKLRDIRSREIGMKKNLNFIEPKINVYEYNASNGKEFFISYDDEKSYSIIGFCRLRFPSNYLRKEINEKTAIVRELHVYGTATSLGKEGLIQHKGFGSKLMKKVEEICLKNGKNKILVISGIGVRNYYRKLGYEKEGPYMAKKI
jgi:elongator complex protein 3